MSIWNPYVFTPTGQPVPPSAPPALRVHGQASAAQITAARAVFHRFCSMARLSAAPNPCEIGRLPDGSSYRITVIGPVTTLELWPVGGSAAVASGVAVRAVVGGVTQLLLIAFIQGKWRVDKRDVVYGSYGLWKAAGSRTHFTDYLSYPAGVRGSGMSRVPAFKHTAQESTLAGQMSDTSAPYGLAYQANAVGARFGFAVGSKFVCASADSRTVSIYEAQLASEDELAATPDEFFAAPAFAKGESFQNEVGARLLVASMNYATLATRYRSIAKLSFSVADFLQPVSDGPSISNDGWVSRHALTHDAIMDATQPGYTVQLVKSGDVVRVLRLPDLSVIVDENTGLVRKPWAATMQRTAYMKTAPQEVIISAQYSRTAGSPQDVVVESRNVTAGYVGAVIGYDELRTYQRKSISESPVYSGVDWSDSKIAFTLNVSEAVSRTVTTSGEYTNNYSNAVHHASSPMVTYNTASLLDPPFLNADGWTFYDGNQWGTIAQADVGAFERAALPPGTQFTDQVAYRMVLNNALKTPWGDISVAETDVVVESVYSSKTGVYALSGTDETQHTLLGVTGMLMRREIIYLSPVLGIIGFVETRVTSWVVAGGVLKPGVFTVDLVLTHKAVEFHRGALPAALFTVPEVPITLGTDRPYLNGRMPDNAVVDNTVVTVHPQLFAVLDSPELSYTQAIFLANTEIVFGHGSIAPTSQSIYLQTGEEIVGAALPIPEATSAGSVTPRDFVYAAIDPNSGGGVLSVVGEDGESFKSWAIAPGVAPAPLIDTLQRVFSRDVTAISHWMVSV